MKQPHAIQLQDYRPPSYLVDELELHFDLLESATRVRARHLCRRHPAADSTAPLLLYGCELGLLALRLDGRLLDAGEFAIDGEILTLPHVPAQFALEVETQIDPAANTALEGLYLSSGNFCTQCEAEGFRRITWYPDRPDVLARFTTTLTADQEKYPVLLANGNLVASGLLENGRHFARWHDPYPKPAYLFALVAGRLSKIEDAFVTRSGRHVLLQIWVEERNLGKCGHAMRSLQKAMRWEEETFGLEYDLDIYMIVAVDDFNMGAMENKGLNVFNSKYVLASPETATDADFQAIEEVIGHEYFHNWTGNRVTCRDWFQLSLKEGLTVYRDQEFAADMTSRAVKRIDDVRLLRNSQFPEDAGPMAHPVRPDSYVEINNFYTSTVYNKGAEVIRMYQALLGRDGFRRGLERYLRQHDGQAATVEDFLAAMAEANSADLAQFMRWYTQAGTPVVRVARAWDAAAKTLTLTVRQSCPPTPGQAHKEPFHLPLAVGLLAADGNDLPLRLEGESAAATATTRILELRRAEEVFRFVDLPAPPIPSLLRNFSAPVRLESDLTEAEMAFLFAHDRDPFNRWEAGQQFASRMLLRLLDALHAGRPVVVDPLFLKSFRRALTDDSADPALLAQALLLPTETWLGEQLPVIDPEGLHAVREAVRWQLARELHDEFLAVMAANATPGAYSCEPLAVGKRSLKNLCLAYLLTLEEDASVAFCLRQLRTGDNMSDVLAALTALGNSQRPERSAALAEFYERWQHEPLVIDKWFTLQATSRREQTLAEVIALTAHPAFTRKNPNRVRALIGAFAQNPVRFHAVDGTGYRFLADEVLTLEARNPQIAARLLGPLSRWRRFDSVRQELMKKELARIAAKPGLSPDVFEIVSKSLA